MNKDELRSSIKLYKTIIKNHIRDIKFAQKRIAQFEKELKKL